MVEFWQAVLSYPTAVYSALLVVVLAYWLLAIAGVVDFDHGHLDVHPHLDGDVGDIGVLASYLVTLGLSGVPLSIAVSLVVLCAWTICALAAIWILPLVPTELLTFVAGSGVLVGAFGLALPCAALAIRPLRKLFVTHNAISNAALVGQSCRIVTRSVDERFGRAEVATAGASVNIRVWAASPNKLGRGVPARIVEYDEARARFRVE